MYKAYCLLGAFCCFVLFVIMCFRIRQTTKEIEETEAELRQIEERERNHARKIIREQNKKVVSR